MVAAAELTVSFAAATTVELFIVVMLLPPDDVSATTEPETVTDVPEFDKTVPPVVVETPLPLKTVKVVPEFTKLANAAAAPPDPEKLFDIVPPLTVVPLMRKIP